MGDMLEQRGALRTSDAADRLVAKIFATECQALEF
jgi:hypothetical protein